MKNRLAFTIMTVPFLVVCGSGDGPSFDAHIEEGTDTGCETSPCSSHDECDDGVACTRDTCVIGGCCEHVPDDDECEPGQTCDPEAGCVDSECDEDADCDDGLDCTNDTCLFDHTCENADTCPEGQHCEATGCVENAGDCSTDEDCSYPGTVKSWEARCVEYADGSSYCGSFCNPECPVALCPEGYECFVDDPAWGSHRYQCMNSSGSCP